jgi:Ser/Thr protein kinase RdoA (MazF antagonist)
MRWSTEPNYGGKSTTFIFRTSDGQFIAKLKHHITELVNMPVFDAWSDYLWQAGQNAMLVRKTRSGGDIDLWTVDLDADSWSRLITGGLEMNMIQLAP